MIFIDIYPPGSRLWDDICPRVYPCAKIQFFATPPYYGGSDVLVGYQ